MFLKSKSRHSCITTPTTPQDCVQSHLLALVNLLPPGKLPLNPVLLDGGEGLAHQAVPLGRLVLATVATVGDLGWGGGQGRGGVVGQESEARGGVVGKERSQRAGYRIQEVKGMWLPQFTWLHLAQGSSESLQKPQFPQPSSGSRSLAENSARSSVW